MRENTITILNITYIREETDSINISSRNRMMKLNNNLNQEYNE